MTKTELRSTDDPRSPTLDADPGSEEARRLTRDTSNPMESLAVSQAEANPGLTLILDLGATVLLDHLGCIRERLGLICGHIYLY